jgi:hypothetical protein
MKIGMMLGFEDSIKTMTNIARAAEGAGINALYTVDAGRSATQPAGRRLAPILSMHMPASPG